MFKIGDIVTLKLERKSKGTHRYIIGHFRELQGTVMIQSIDYGYSVEVLPKNMVLDIDYMRKMKLRKICTRLGTR
jgi:hypothetical protein